MLIKESNPVKRILKIIFNLSLKPLRLNMELRYPVRFAVNTQRLFEFDVNSILSGMVLSQRIMADSKEIEMIILRSFVLQVQFKRNPFNFSASAILILLLVNTPEAWGNECCLFHGGADYCLSQSGKVVCKDGTICSSCECVAACSYYAGKEHSLSSSDLYNKYVLVEKGYRDKLRLGYYKFAESSRGQDKNEKNKAEYNKSNYLLFEIFGGFETYMCHINSKPRYNAVQEIEAEIEPIYLGNLQINASIPLIFFRGVYKYDFKQKGGTINSKRENYINEYVDRDRLKYFLNIVGGIIGFEFGFQTETFEYGKYRYYTSDYGYGSERDDLQGVYPFQISSDQLQVRYHFWWYKTPRLGGVTGENYPFDIYVGYRYRRMNLPGIIYELDENKIPVGESLPQNIEYRVHYAGIGFGNQEKLPDKGSNLYWELELFAGKGKTTVNVNDYNGGVYSFSGAYSSSRENMDILAFDIGLRLGWLVNFIHSGIFMSIKLEYSANLGMQFITTSKGTHTYERSEDDGSIFHSVELSGEITF